MNKKNSFNTWASSGTVFRAIVWTAYSRRQKRVIAYTIGEGVKKAMEIYLKAKTMVGKILQIYSDVNSCYDVLKITLDLFFTRILFCLQ